MIAILLVACGQLTSNPPSFDSLTQPVLAKAITTETAVPVDKLTTKRLHETDRLVGGAVGTLVLCKTNQGRLAKILMQPARQKVDGTTSLPMIILERFETFRPGQDRAFTAKGQDICLFEGFRFSLDLGQVVPDVLVGDLKVSLVGGEIEIAAVGSAKLYLPNKSLATAEKQKDSARKGEAYSTAWIRGKYKLHDDGRRQGDLELDIADNGDISGTYYSAKDGKKYDVWGKVGVPKHSLQFVIRLPQAEQHFQGWIFTGDGNTIVGTSRLGEREAGFQATRLE